MSVWWMNIVDVMEAAGRLGLGVASLTDRIIHTSPKQGLDQATGGVYIWKYEKVRRNGRGGWEMVQVCKR